MRNKIIGHETSDGGNFYRSIDTWPEAYACCKFQIRNGTCNGRSRGDASPLSVTKKDTWILRTNPGISCSGKSYTFGIMRAHP